MIVCVGLDHHSAPLEARARGAVPHLERQTVQTSLINRFGQVVLVATCGRLELYLDAQDSDITEVLAAARAWLARRANIDAETAAAAIMTHRGEDAVRHVLRVACGLDSVLVGEDEILGQLRLTRTLALAHVFGMGASTAARHAPSY